MLESDHGTPFSAKCKADSFGTITDKSILMHFLDRMSKGYCKEKVWCFYHAFWCWYCLPNMAFRSKWFRERHKSCRPLWCKNANISATNRSTGLKLSDFPCQIPWNMTCKNQPNLKWSPGKHWLSWHGMTLYILIHNITILYRSNFISLAKYTEE